MSCSIACLDRISWSKCKKFDAKSISASITHPELMKNPTYSMPCVASFPVNTGPIHLANVFPILTIPITLVISSLGIIEVKSTCRGTTSIDVVV